MQTELLKVQTECMTKDRAVRPFPRVGGVVFNRKLYVIIAQRGRENGQEYESRYDGIVNTITTVQKDNLYVAKIYRS